MPFSIFKYFSHALPIIRGLSEENNFEGILKVIPAIVVAEMPLFSIKVGLRCFV